MHCSVLDGVKGILPALRPDEVVVRLEKKKKGVRAFHGRYRLTSSGVKLSSMAKYASRMSDDFRDVMKSWRSLAESWFEAFTAVGRPWSWLSLLS